MALGQISEEGTHCEIESIDASQRSNTQNRLRFNLGKLIYDEVVVIEEVYCAIKDHVSKNSKIRQARSATGARSKSFRLIYQSTINIKSVRHYLRSSLGAFSKSTSFLTMRINATFLLTFSVNAPTFS